MLLLLLRSCFRKALDPAAAAKGEIRPTLRSSGAFFLLPVAAACVSELLFSFAGDLLDPLAVVDEGLQALAVVGGDVGLLAVVGGDAGLLAVDVEGLQALAVVEGDVGLLAVDVEGLQALAVADELLRLLSGVSGRHRLPSPPPLLPFAVGVQLLDLPHELSFSRSLLLSVV